MPAWTLTGRKDPQLVDADWQPTNRQNIEGVKIRSIDNMLGDHSRLTEIWRRDWQLDDRPVEQVFQSEIVIDGDTTTLERLLEDYDDESVIEEGRKTLHISVPSKSIDITVDKKQGELRVNADGRKVSVKASETDDEASVTIRRETDAADSAKTARGSAARSR